MTNIEATKTPLDIVKGDRVWAGSSNYPRSSGIRTVAKVTPTQIVIDWNGDGKYLKRFSKTGGRWRKAEEWPAYVIGHSMMGDCLNGLATDTECAVWDRKQAEKKADFDRVEREKED